jgi:crotonobetainyl-CoA:carnitine CoA-transferase CaiB-like acyl-CoA transferase
MVENFRHDVKGRLGIDYGSLRAVNPGIVYGSISASARTAPTTSAQASIRLPRAWGGDVDRGAPGEGPMRVGIPVADLTTGLFCAMGILTALLERDVSGQTEWVQTSLLQAQIFMLDFQAARWLMEKEVPKGRQQPPTLRAGDWRA